MSRQVLFSRTRTYLGPELMLALLLLVFYLPIFGVGVLKHLRSPELGRVLSGAALTLGLVLGSIALEILLLRWRYVLDLLFCSARGFRGRVELAEEIPRATRMSARSWRVRTQDGAQRFLLLEGGPSLASLCQGETAFVYLERSRIIVETMDKTPAER